jgi:hypothetical protein
MFSSNTSQVSGAANYIEDVFSTYLYTGTGSNITINNGIDLAGKGGLTWFKSRSGGYNNALLDTARGTNKAIFSNAQSGNSTFSYLTSFNSNGVTFPGSFSVNNNSGQTYSLWTFRKQPKFFDIVTYTGNGALNRQIAHSLGSTPGCMIIKRTDTTSNWTVYHRSLASAADVLQLEGVSGAFTSANRFDSTAPTSTVFTLGDSSATNLNGGTYIAYLFAHNAGGFGLTGADNVISCGSYTGLSTGQTITLGYEPQWVLVKKSNASSNWYLMDTMRGMTAYNTTGKKELYPNLDLAEAASADTAVSPTATGFVVGGGGMSDNGDTYVYIAIRRGPMKVPTSGTSVFTPLSRAGTSSLTTISSGGVGPVDTIMAQSRDVANGMRAWDRLRGVTNWLGTYTTQAETAASGSVIGFDSMTGVIVNDGANEVINTNSAASPYINYMFRRAPGFFDEVCYDGKTGSTQIINHNLGVSPELVIIKCRQTSTYIGWPVYASSVGTANLFLNDTSSAGTYLSNAIRSPTATTFTVDNNADVNGVGKTFVAYLFATCAGVSKVGSYTGNGSTQTINCGFTGGARFILIKRTNLGDSSSNWYVWDSARGITSGNDPSLMLNSTAAEVVDWNSVGVDSTGFTVTQNAYSVINSSGGTYIFLAIA